MTKNSIPAILVISLLFAGCLQQDIPCSSNIDCPPGTFCIDGKCSNLECKEEGATCASVWECCGSLECVNNVCESIPELEHTVKITLQENGEAHVYGSVLEIGEIHTVFDSNCQLKDGSVEIEFTDSGGKTSDQLGIGEEFETRGSSIKLRGIFSSFGEVYECPMTSKYAVIEVSRTVYFNNSITPNREIMLPGAGITIRLVNLTGFDNPDVNIPCRFERTATVEIISEQGNTTIEIQNDKPTVLDDSEFQIDVPGISSCIGPQPILTMKLVQREQKKLVEGQDEQLMGNILLKLEKLDVLSKGKPCAIQDASAVISFKNTESALEFGVVRIDQEETSTFGGLYFTLKDVGGAFQQPKKGCGFQNPDVLFSIKSGMGTGGLFQNRVPEDAVIFIEQETVREEAPLSGECTGQNKRYSEYEFDIRNRVLGHQGQLNSETKVVYGKVRKITGQYQSTSKTLVSGDSIPFKDNVLGLTGVNKAGDANILYGDIVLVLGVGESSSFQKEGTENFGNCLLEVKTTVKITNHGFVRISG
ncbi:MAG: dickkopf-related protein [Candidatus Micrarchaeota archaeon]